MSERLKHFIALTRLNRPIGILLLLWPTLWAIWIASEGRPDTTILLVFAVGTILMRSAGCAINDYADRDFDAHVERTADRPLASKKISAAEALVVAGVLALIAFSLVVIFLNRQTLYLSFIALFLAASYPFTKRFFAMPQAYLGIAFGFGIPMAFAAETGSVPMLAWWMLVANVVTNHWASARRRVGFSLFFGAPRPTCACRASGPRPRALTAHSRLRATAGGAVR